MMSDARLMIFYDKGVAKGTKSGIVSICWRNIWLRQCNHFQTFRDRYA